MRRAPRPPAAGRPGRRTGRLPRLPRRPRVDLLSGTYGRATGRLVPVAPAVLGAVLTSMSLAHLATVQDVQGAFLALASGTVGITVCVAALLLRRRRPTGHRAHAVLAFCLVLAALDALAADRMSGGGPTRSADLVLLVGGACAVLLDRRWLAGTLALLGGIWGAALLGGPAVTVPYSVATMVLALVAGLAMRRSRLSSLAELAVLERRAALAVLDPLTGLPDRRGLQLVGQHLVAIARRESGAVGCTFVGIDGMAAVRAAYGPEGVDVLVRHVAAITRSVVRATDVVGRWRDGMLVVVTHGAGAPMEVLEERIATRLAQDCPIPADVWPRRLVLGRAVMEPWTEGGLVTLLSAAERDIHARMGSAAPEPSDETRAALEAESASASGAEAWRTVTARTTPAGV